MLKKNNVMNRSTAQRKECEMNRKLEERQACLERIVEQLEQRMTKMEEGHRNTMNNGYQKLKWILLLGVRSLFTWFF